MATYLIKIYGSGAHCGAEKLTNEQFAYWNDRDDIDEALDPVTFNDQLHNKIPVDALLRSSAYWDLNNTLDLSGLFLSNENEIKIIVSDRNGESLFDNSLSELEKKIQSLDEFSSLLEEVEEFYFEWDMPSGKYLWWSRSGHGLWFSAGIDIPEGEKFDEGLLKFHTVDFEGETLIFEVLYNGVPLMNDGYDQNWSDPIYSFFQSVNADKDFKKTTLTLY